MNEKIFAMTDKQWQDFSGEFIPNISISIQNVNAIAFEDLQQLTGILGRLEN